MNLPFLTNCNGTTLVDRIGKLRLLEDGWLDGYGKALTSQACDLAEYVVPKVFNGRPDHKAFIYPTPAGGLEVEVDQKGYSYFISFWPDGSTIELDCCYDAKEDTSLMLTGLSRDDYVVVLDDWIEFL